MLRFKVLDEAISRKAVNVSYPSGRPADYFGSCVFNQEKMLKYLPPKCYPALNVTIRNGVPLDRGTTDCV